MELTKLGEEAGKGGRGNEWGMGGGIVVRKNFINI